MDDFSNYIDGHAVVPSKAQGTLHIVSPADLQDTLGSYPYDTALVDAAVASAREAFPSWRHLSRDSRKNLLRGYQDQLRKHADSLTNIIAREVGKPLWDARGEVQAMIAKVDLSLGEGESWTLDRTLPDISGEIRYRPHGVSVVIGPFNFPGHLPNGQIVPALLLGNTIVFKPSEKTPTVASWMARCFHEAGFPKGVFNLVQGGAEIAQALVRHPDVHSILFTGSVEVGKKILAAHVDHPGRLLALELGGKNASIVVDDCNLERTARQIAFAAYASAGQRCTATSRVFVTQKIAERLIQRLTELAKNAVVGYPLNEGVFLGPLISETARGTFVKATARAQAAGFTPVVLGGAIEKVGDHIGWYAKPSLHCAPRADIRVDGYTHDELFGPDIALYRVDDLDHAIALTNQTKYGLAASVFTQSKDTFEHAAEHLEVGVLYWNRPTAGASSRLPFGGVKDSGNHRPAGILMGASCAYPQAVLLSPAEASPLNWPGFDVRSE